MTFCVIVGVESDCRQVFATVIHDERLRVGGVPNIGFNSFKDCLHLQGRKRIVKTNVNLCRFDGRGKRVTD